MNGSRSDLGVPVSVVHAGVEVHVTVSAHAQAQAHAHNNRWGLLAENISG